MINRNVIDVLSVENQRFTDLMRIFDGGIWWNSDSVSQIEAEAILTQAAHIRIALDEITRLAKKIAA